MPDSLWTLVITAFGAAALTLLGSFIGSALQNRREHLRWVREQRLDAYRAFFQASELTWPSQSKDETVWRTFMDDMGTSLTVVGLVGPDSAAVAATDHLEALLQVGGIQRKVNGVEDGTKHPELNPEYGRAAVRLHGTRAKFVFETRKALGIQG